MHVNLDAAELDILVEALDAVIWVDDLIKLEPNDQAIALRAKLAGTCR